MCTFLSTGTDHMMRASMTAQYGGFDALFQWLSDQLLHL